MTLSFDNILDRFTALIDPNQLDDPDNKYDTDSDGTDENNRPDVSDVHWGALWHYLDRAIVDELVTNLGGAIDAYHSGSETISSGGEMTLDTDRLIDGSIYARLGGVIEFKAPGRHHLHYSASFEASSNREVITLIETDTGSGWSEVSGTRSLATVESSGKVLTSGDAIVDVSQGDLFRIYGEELTGNSISTFNESVTLKARTLQ